VLLQAAQLSIPNRAQPISVRRHALISRSGNLVSARTAHATQRIALDVSANEIAPVASQARS